MPAQPARPADARARRRSRAAQGSGGAKDNPQSRDAIQENAETFQTIFENSASAMAIIERDATISMVNRQYCRISLREPDEIIGKRWDTQVPPEEVERLKTYNRARQSDPQSAPDHHEFRFCRKDGAIRHCLLFTSCLPAQQRIVCSFVDITERKQAENALQESAARFRQLLQDVKSVAVQGYGPDGTTQYWNQASEQLYGYTAQEAVGRNLLELIIPPEMREDVARAVRQMADTGEPIPATELSLMRKDGSRVAVFSSHTIVRVPGRPQELFCVDIDLTGLKRAEEEKSRLEAQLQQAQKMESVGRLAGGVAHDFNNLLMGIMSYVELCRENLPDEHPVRRYLDEITHDTQRSANLTRQLLAFARKQTISPRILDLNDAVGGMLTLLRRLIGEDINLTWQPAADLWPVRLDPSQMDQLLANLCVNARDAIAGVGSVTIQTANATLDDAYCAAHAGAAPGEHVLLAVIDNGCGMSRETLDRVFEPFFTTKEMGKGTGLGLATVYGIVKQNDGFIDVVSAPGQGTAFRIYLPRAAAGAAMRPPALDEPADSPRGHETVLLVEDERSIRITATRFIEALGYAVLSSESPEDALRQAKTHTGTIHLLLTDVVMPGMNGRQLADRLRADRPDIRCLFMSGYTADVIAHRGMLDANVHFIQKPFSRGALARKMRETLDGDPTLTGGATNKEKAGPS